MLLLGEPGAGKSDLALRLIDRGAKLVADDQVELSRKGREVLAASPKNIAGLIEVRGVGIFRMRAKKTAPVLLVVQLEESVERLPHPESYECLGAHLPLLRLNPFEPSAVIKVEMAVNALQDGSLKVGAFKE